MILCCRIPEVPLAALLLLHPELCDRPVVIGGLPGERRPVRAASPEARSFGICAGMPLRQAEQLCPTALFFANDLAAEASVVRHLLAGLYALAPRVELDADGGEAYVDLDGMGLLGGAGGLPGEDRVTAFARRTVEYLARRLKTRPRAGIGSNKFVAHTAAAVAGDGEPVVVPRGCERSFLAPLPVAGNLPIDPAAVERLRIFGLRTLGDLAAMPLAAVETQFGAEGLWALRLARGEDSRPLCPWDPPQRMEEQSRLDPAMDNIEPLLFLARGLVDRLGDRLLEGGYAATTVRLRLEVEEGSGNVEAMLRLRAPMSSAEDLWTPVSGLIRRQRLQRAVCAIHLRVSGFCPAGSRQMDLLVRRDSRLEDIARQALLLADAHGPHLLMSPRAAAAPSLLDDRRFHWAEPAEGLLRQVLAPRRGRPKVRPR